uniref:Uncharacterized protein n=1 Tax=viral metagenome TaxID=1070528 RepID=A0A6C0JAR9_9ZZZZ
MVITTSIEVFASNYRQEQAKRFWNSTYKYQKFSTPSPPVSPVVPPPSFQKKTSSSNTYKPGDLITYGRGRGKSKIVVTARVISVAKSGMSVRTEDGHIVNGEFIPSGVPNPTTKDCLNTSRIKPLAPPKPQVTNFSNDPKTALRQMKDIVIPHFEYKQYILEEVIHSSHTTYDYLKIRRSHTKSSPMCILEYGSSPTAKSWKIGTIRIINISDEKRTKYQKYIKERNSNTIYFSYYGKNIKDTIYIIKDLLK